MPDKVEPMLSKVIDLERELGRLRQVLLERGGDMEIGQDAVDRLQSIREELREILPDQIS